VTEKAKPAPNTRLRSERERRGWTREYVAGKIGSDARTVGRWERGTTSPSPFYRQRLCELFEMDAEALGFFKDTTAQDSESFGQQDEETNRGRELDVPTKQGFLSHMIGQSNLAKLLVLGGVVVTMSLLFWVLLFRLLIPQTPHIRPLIKPGGVWVNPANGQVVHGVMHFAAHAYPTNFGDPAIDHVNFTVTWPGGHWQVACIAYPPAIEDIFRCDVSLHQLGAPDGRVTVSFDVYDQGGNTNFAPNGEHVITYYAV
jgi:transcriptional regulator with XRE-family HTH domain